MANTTFKYATQRDIKDIIPNIDSYDTKEIIRNFSNVAGSVWISYDTGLVTNLFADGEKLEKASVGSANAPNTTTNQVLLDNQADGDSNNYNTLVVADASSFQKGDFIRLQYTSGDTTITEYVQIDGISNNTLTVKRGMLGTTPQLITNGANVHLYIRVTENNQWYYDNLSDQLIIYSAPTRSPNDDIVIESGEDYKTYIDRMLSNGAMELNGLLDARFPRPIQPVFLDGNTTAQYDYPLVRCNALITASYMVQTKDLEHAEQLYNQVTNSEGTGIADRINKGDITLAFEVDKTDSSGDIVEIINTGSMKLVETWGNWVGEKYDRVKLKCTTLGNYGTAQCSVNIFGSDQLYGELVKTITITGTMQEICNGLYCRFEGSAMSVDDEWHIVVRNGGIVETNTNAYTVGLYK